MSRPSSPVSDRRGGAIHQCREAWNRPQFLPMLTSAAACLFYAAHMGTPENILAQKQAQESGVGGWEFPSSAAAVVGSSGTGDGAASQAGFHHLHELVRE